MQPSLKLQMFCSNFPFLFPKTLQENYDREFIIGEIKLGSASQEYIVLWKTRPTDFFFFFFLFF